MATRKQIFDKNRDLFREIVQVDHFGNAVPDSIVDLWLMALDPASTVTMPADIKGFYGGDLRASIPIELAHDCYKYVVHETEQTKIDKYAGRMLVALSVLDMDQLSEKDANLASLALWHKSMAQARLHGNAMELSDTLNQYEKTRARATLGDAKLPQLPRLKARLLAAAEELGNTDVVGLLKTK